MPESGQMMNKKLAREQLAAWRNMLALRPDDSEVMQNVASCLFTLGDNDEALKLYPVAYEMNRNSAAIAMPPAPHERSEEKSTWSKPGACSSALNSVLTP